MLNTTFENLAYTSAARQHQHFKWVGFMASSQNYPLKQFDIFHLLWLWNPTLPVVVADGCAQVKVPNTNCCCGGVLLVAGTLKPAERERQVCAGVTISQPTPPPATTLPPLVKADFKHGRGERWWAWRFPCSMLYPDTEQKVHEQSP